MGVVWVTINSSILYNCVNWQPYNIWKDRAIMTLPYKSLVYYYLSFADCFVVAPARKMDAVIMAGDPEFKNVEHIIEIEWLAK